jgi:hypothetical protein
VASTKLAVIFRPWFALLISLLGAAVYGAYLLRSPSVRSHIFELSGTFMYVAPIVVPFIAFLLDRVERWSERKHSQKLVDAIVVFTAMWRVVGNVPFVSGHTLFLTYCILTSRSVVARLTAVLVMTQTVYLKYFVWHDWVTSTSGIVLGCVATLVVLQLERWSWEHRRPRLLHPLLHAGRRERLRSQDEREIP